jgi:hypothetical protein
LLIRGEARLMALGRDREGAGPRERRLVLLEVLLIASAVIALIILVVWSLVGAHSPTSPPLPGEGSGGGGQTHTPRHASVEVAALRE